MNAKRTRLLKRIALTLIAVTMISLLLSLLKPSWPLLAQMEGRNAAGKIRARVEEKLGKVDEANPVFFGRFGGDKTCADQIRKELGGHEGWLPQAEKGAGRIDLTCRKDCGSLIVDVTLSVPGDASKAAEFQVVRKLPDFRSLLPPVIAVIVALGLGEVRVALAAGIWLGAVLFGGLGWTLGIWTALRRYILETVFDQFSFTIIVFTLAMVGMVRVAARAGGSHGIADAISRFAASARSGKIATTLLGLAVFFDDYSNTVIVGSTMRALTDKFKVSREKLAYIVDSTSAPVAGIALISTWIGYEIGLFQELSDALGLGIAGYGMFLKIVPLRFYCYFAIGLVLLTSITNRDFGPMLKAERRSMLTGQLTAPGSKPMLSTFMSGEEVARYVRPNWIVAAIPIGVVVFGTFWGMLFDGAKNEGPAQWALDHGKFNLTYVRLCFESANGATILLIAALAGSWTAVIMALTRRATLFEKSEKPSFTRCPWWQLFLPLPLSVVTAFGIAAIAAGSSTDGASMVTAGYWKILALNRENAILFFIFIPAGLAATAILGWRISRQKPGNINTAIPITFTAAGSAWIQGLRSLLYAVSILIMAWAIRKVCDDLGTSTFIVATMGQFARPWMIPAMVFIIACLTSFCTGTSWGTMGILIPTLLPFAYYIGGMEILMLSMGAVLDGAIFGDHCSPVSDTTVLSSTFSSCDHMDHIKTQIPYAVLCSILALLVGYLPIAANIPLYAVYAAGLLLMIAALLVLGKKVVAKSPA